MRVAEGVEEGGEGGERGRQTERETELRREGENQSYKQTHTISKDGKWRKRGTYNRERGGEQKKY